MRRKEYGLAGITQREDDGAQVLAADGVEAGEGLVEDEQVGVVDQGLGQTEALDHPLGELAQLQVLVTAQADAVDQGGDRVLYPGGGEVEEGGGEVEELAGGEVVVKIGVLGEKTDAAPRRLRKGGLAVDQDLPGVRGQQSHDAFDGGGLAGAVRAQETIDLALFHVEVNAFQDIVLLDEEV